MTAMEVHCALNLLQTNADDLLEQAFMPLGVGFKTTKLEEQKLEEE